MMAFYLILLLFIVLIIFKIVSTGHDTKAPPGPKPLPILGNLLNIAMASKDLTRTFSNLAYTYGEIFSLKMGLKDTVVLTSKEAIETILPNEAVFGRDRTGMLLDRSFHKNLGIATSEGEMWTKTRSWSLKNLRDYGFGKSAPMEIYVKKSSEILFKKVNQSLNEKDGILEVENLYDFSILTIMWQMITGRLKPEDDDDLDILATKGTAMIRSTLFGLGLVNCYPFIRYVIPDLTGFKIQMEFFNASHGIAKKLYDQFLIRMQQNPEEGPKGLLTAFLENVEADEDIFNCENFQLVFQDLMLGSTDTTSSYLEAATLFLSLHPDIQEKIHQEIMDVVSSDEEITFMHRKRMIYTQAFQLEVHRNARTLQNYVPRKALSDFKYKDYLIKKGTVVMVDIYKHCNDPKIWGDPENFRPERFITKNGSICEDMKSNILSFSVGKRNCPGENYATVVSFLLLTALIKRYKISIPPGHPKPRKDMRAGVSLRPYPFEIKVQRREH